MVGEILSFLHRHVRIATLVAVGLFVFAVSGAWNLIAHLPR